jgi:uncharacterized Tic20 family protein
VVKIPWKFRFLAALMHLIGGTPATSFLMSVALEIYYFKNKNILSTSLGNYILNTQNLIIYTGLLSPIISLLLWVLTKKIHSFVDRSGANAIDYMLNTVVSILLCYVVMMLGFEIVGGSGSENMTPIVIGFIVSTGLACFYSGSSAIAIILAIRGNHYENLIIYSFVNLLRNLY